jgi:hypothetical protein
MSNFRNAWDDAAQGQVVAVSSVRGGVFASPISGAVQEW